MGFDSNVCHIFSLSHLQRTLLCSFNVHNAPGEKTEIPHENYTLLAIHDCDIMVEVFIALY